MTDGQTLYATDEDIAIRASADFALLCPRDQKLASGNDGMFTIQDRWTLVSPTVDFQAFGLKFGHVVLLPQHSGGFKLPEEIFAVERSASNAVTLRRKGQEPGFGQPAGPPNGLAQVEFGSATLGPQIASAGDELDRRYGVNDLVTGRRHCDQFDPREVREAAVLIVLHRQYLELSRGDEGKGDTYAAKAQLYKRELDDLLARTVVRWMTAPSRAGVGSLTRSFGTRLSR